MNAINVNNVIVAKVIGIHNRGEWRYYSPTMEGFSKIISMTAAGILGWSLTAHGQNSPPFFGQGVAGYDEQVVTIPAGQIIRTDPDPQAMKYITMGGVASTAGPQVHAIYRIQTTQPHRGFVGGVEFDSPQNENILTRRGTFLISPLD